MLGHVPGPDRAPGAFEAEAQLTVRPRGLLFRALRAEEVERGAGGEVGLAGRGLRPGSPTRHQEGPLEEAQADRRPRHPHPRPPSLTAFGASPVSSDPA